MDYRKKYSQEVEKVPADFEIHHIDFNRKNNDVENLVMLPKQLHKKYHNFIKNNECILNLKLTNKISNFSNVKIIETYKELEIILIQCRKYLIRKENAVKKSKVK